MEPEAKFIPGEQTLWTMRQSSFVLIRDMLAPLLGLGLIALLLGLVGFTNVWVFAGVIVLIILIDAAIFISWQMTVYRLTTKRIESRSGVFSVSREEIYLEDVQSVDTKKNFLGIIFNFGDVIVEAAGHNTVSLNKISNMKTVADQIADLSLQHPRHQKPPVV
jgi:uncharacterized membrane protein YdbT with pleckstrin-like domain